jgi:hypothetical protein
MCAICKADCHASTAPGRRVLASLAWDELANGVERLRERLATVEHA